MRIRIKEISLYKRSKQIKNIRCALTTTATPNSNHCQQLQAGSPHGRKGRHHAAAAMQQQTGQQQARHHAAAGRAAAGQACTRAPGWAPPGAPPGAPVWEAHNPNIYIYIYIGFGLFPGVLEGLGSSGRLTGTISTNPGTSPMLW